MSPISRDDVIAIDNEVLLDMVRRMSSVRELSLYVIGENTFVQESIMNDGSRKVSLSIHGTLLKVNNEQFTNLIKFAVATYRYIRSYVTGNLNIIGCDGSTIVFQYEVRSNHITYYSVKG